MRLRSLPPMVGDILQGKHAGVNPEVVHRPVEGLAGDAQELGTHARCIAAVSFCQAVSTQTRSEPISLEDWCVSIWPA